MAENRFFSLTQAEVDEYLLSHFEEALDRHYIKAYYQPLIRTVSGTLCGYEALARWEDPEYGLIPPFAFIALFEKHGLIAKLDMYIIRDVCRQMRQTLDAGETLVPVSVNLSRLDFELCDVFREIEQITFEYEIYKDMLHIEITESVFNNNAEMQTIVQNLRSSGYQVWMDDFGSGYSSLNVLKDYDFDLIKIDMKFLSEDSFKSRRIITSLVDMAKEIHIMTLTEGVETKEQYEFLKSIGCEICQGYYFGKPEPYEEYNRLITQEERFTVEDRPSARYYTEIGRVNFMSTTPFQFEEDQDELELKLLSSIPISVIEFQGKERYRYLYLNDSYKSALIDATLMHGNEASPDNVFDITEPEFKSFFDKSMTYGESYFDFVRNGQYFTAHGKLLARKDDYSTILLSIENKSHDTDKVRLDRLDSMMRHIYGIYESVVVLHLDRDYMEELLGDANELKDKVNRSGARATIEDYAFKNVYVDDRDRYAQFIDLDTIQQRIKSSPKGFVTTFVRVINPHGIYTWKFLMAMQMLQDHVTIFMRDADEEKAEAWNNSEIDKHSREQTHNESNGIDVGTLWKSSLQATELGIFWKDKNRRFMGANQTFLDYYGFKTIDEIYGKTDEDMGWHVTPGPYKDDEIKVINEGAHTHMVPGHCIAHGNDRNIVASKVPLYDNGEIVGLLGYFRDVTDDDTADFANKVHNLNIHDNVTGLLNMRGIMEKVLRYVDEYEINHTDFIEILFSIDNFHEQLQLYGNSVGEKLLATVADKLKDRYGTNSLVGRYSGSIFVIVTQIGEISEKRSITSTPEGHATISVPYDGDVNPADRIRLNDLLDTVTSIHDIGGAECTLYLSAGCARYSENGDIDKLHQAAGAAMDRERARHLKNKKK